LILPFLFFSDVLHIPCLTLFAPSLYPPPPIGVRIPSPFFNYRFPFPPGSSLSVFSSHHCPLLFLAAARIPSNPNDPPLQQPRLHIRIPNLHVFFFRFALCQPPDGNFSKSFSSTRSYHLFDRYFYAFLYNLKDIPRFPLHGLSFSCSLIILFLPPTKPAFIPFFDKPFFLRSPAPLPGDHS